MQHLIGLLEGLNRKMKNNPEKEAVIAAAITALRDCRCDIETAIELEIYAKIDQEDGRIAYAQLLLHCASLIRRFCLPKGA